ncbi:hypothetical protein I633_16130 [Alteromonas mediterranea 615]|uniref:DUF4177 domain-containing protein n=1 Tax=Alteromonas mediterranea 615 TaxID=1300253 RepID=S5APV0_9ALTE|nr:hypothetical protein I633_16130 [Alteromonas mediterranea 615]
MGLFTNFKKSRLEKKFKKNEWVVIQPIPFAQFEQLIVDHVDSGWELKTTMKGWQKIRQSGNANYAKEPVFSPAFGQLTTKVLYMGLNGCLQDYLKS